MTKSQLPVWARDWFNDVVSMSKFKVSRINLKNSFEWSYSLDAIRHKSGLFFNVVGVSWKDPNGRVIGQPLIEQREIGTLGFLVKTVRGKNKILVQAKVEPGNIGVCQIGPTYQATASNAAQVHGGLPPAYKSFFDDYGANLIFQSLQSEQGSRFLGKLNRNIMIKTKKKVVADFRHRWVGVDELLACTNVDNFMNTDSRSVLVCAPWQKLVGRQPFSKDNSLLATQLKKSYQTVNTSKIKKISDKLDAVRQNFKAPEVISLGDLMGWKLTAGGIKSSTNKPFEIRQIKVHAIGREVTDWDQPIIDSNGQGRIVLFCTLINGVMNFCFKARPEPGLVNKIELGPTIMIEPGGSGKTNLPRGYKILAEVNQSDEGGRFFRDISHYSIVQVSSRQTKQTDSGNWLTLGEIKQLLTTSTFNNESRSVLSLLLKWV